MGRGIDVEGADLIDWARWRLQLPSDRALCRVLALPPAALSKIRHCRQPIGPTVLVKLLEATDTHLRDLPARVNETARLWRRACRR